MMRLETCCYQCTYCGSTICRDNEPSPGEQGDMCADCYDALVTAEVPC